MTPVPGPVVNEYEDVESDVEKIARQLHAQHQDEPAWDKLESGHRDDYHLFAARVLQCPSVAAAFEAQAKLEALLAGEGDLPEGWTERWRSVYPWSDLPNGCWMGGPPSAAPRRFGLVDRQVVETDRGYVERQFVSPAVRVEEGGESS